MGPDAEAIPAGTGTASSSGIFFLFTEGDRGGGGEQLRVRWMGGGGAT